MKILVTGCCGFIGYHLILNILKSGNNQVYGIDNLNTYYDVKLKKQRLDEIKKKFPKFRFYKIDICDDKKLKNFFSKNNFKIVINLAAQAGVRHSIKEPRSYLTTNINGFFNILDNCRIFKIKHLLYASTSSVYGDNKKFPLQEDYDTDKPASFYAATKKSNEILAYSYSSIYGLKTTGLRFFTVYGPFGRPDMALFKFTKNISQGKKVELFNRGNHIRDFTYVDDVVGYIGSLINKPSKKKVPYQVFNVGSNNPKSLKYFLRIIERNLNKVSKKKYLPFQKGDVHKTHADIALIKKYTKLSPKFSIERGIKYFIEWYSKHYKIK